MYIIKQMNYVFGMIKFFIIVHCILFSFSRYATLGPRAEFNLKSKDGLANITGVLTQPQSEKEKNALVIMVPGTGLFDAEVHFGISNTSKDLIFLEIEKELLKIGYSVIRMNYRGVFCNFSNFPSRSNHFMGEKLFDAYQRECIDSSIRATVTPENMRDDFELVYKWAIDDKKIKPQHIVMFGHSEGSTHIARLIEQKRINPHSLVFMGGVTESLDSLIRWQIVERVVDALVLMDADQDGMISNEEMRRGHASSVISVLPIESLLSPTGSWTKKSIFNLLDSQYKSLKKNTLLQDDRKPYPDHVLTQASYRWWKMFFKTDTSMIDALFHYQGMVFYHNGTIDSQTNAFRQKSFLDNDNKPHNITFRVHDDRGHTLGLDPLWGPIDDKSMSIMMSDFKTIFDSM